MTQDKLAPKHPQPVPRNRVHEALKRVDETLLDAETKTDWKDRVQSQKKERER